MNATVNTPQPQTQRPKRKERRINVRLEMSLAARLEKAANESDISPSDKVRRILDAALPQTL